MGCKDPKGCSPQCGDCEGPLTCHACGEQILTTPGDFEIPEEQLRGVCCGICGPRVEAFLTKDPQQRTLADLPEGPLRALLTQRGQIRTGLMLLDLTQWLWGQCGRLDFYVADGGEHRVKASCPKQGGPAFERHEFDSNSISQAIRGLGQLLDAARTPPN